MSESQLLDAPVEGASPKRVDPRRILWPSLAQLRKREPFRIWPLLVAIIALSIQSVTYGLLSWFYGVFGVSPEEVGFSYSDILGRNSLQLILATLSGLLILAALSLSAGLLGALAGLYWWGERRSAQWQTSTEGAKASARQTAAVLGGFTLLLIMMTLFPSATGVAIALIGAATVALLGEVVWAKRVGSVHHSILFRMTVLKQYYSSIRIAVLLIAAMTLGIVIPGWKSAVLVTLALVVVNALLPRTSDFEEPLRSQAMLSLDPPR